MPKAKRVRGGASHQGSNRRLRLLSRFLRFPSIISSVSDISLCFKKAKRVRGGVSHQGSNEVATAISLSPIPFYHIERFRYLALLQKGKTRSRWRKPPREQRSCDCYLAFSDSLLSYRAFPLSRFASKGKTRSRWRKPPRDCHATTWLAMTVRRIEHTPLSHYYISTCVITSEAW